MTSAITYKPAAVLGGSVFATLAFVLFSAPAFIFYLFELEGGAEAILIARRAAVLFAGIAYLLLGTANHAPTPTRQTITMAMVLLLGGLALLGIIEWVRGSVGIGIWFAVLTEISLAFMFGLAGHPSGDEGRAQ